MGQEERGGLILEGKGGQVRYRKELMRGWNLVCETKGNGFWKGVVIIVLIFILILILLFLIYTPQPTINITVEYVFL